MRSAEGGEDGSPHVVVRGPSPPPLKHEEDGEARRYLRTLPRTTGATRGMSLEQIRALLAQRRQQSPSTAPRHSSRPSKHPQSPTPPAPAWYTPSESVQPARRPSRHGSHHGSPQEAIEPTAAAAGGSGGTGSFSPFSMRFPQIPTVGSSYSVQSAATTTRLHRRSTAVSTSTASLAQTTAPIYYYQGFLRVRGDKTHEEDADAVDGMHISELNGRSAGDGGDLFYVKEGTASLAGATSEAARSCATTSLTRRLHRLQKKRCATTHDPLGTTSTVAASSRSPSHSPQKRVTYNVGLAEAMVATAQRMNEAEKKEHDSAPPPPLRAKASDEASLRRSSRQRQASFALSAASGASTEGGGTPAGAHFTPSTPSSLLPLSLRRPTSFSLPTSSAVPPLVPQDLPMARPWSPCCPPQPPPPPPYATPCEAVGEQPAIGAVPPPPPSARPPTSSTAMSSFRRAVYTAGSASPSVSAVPSPQPSNGAGGPSRPFSSGPIPTFPSGFSFSVSGASAGRAALDVGVESDDDEDSAAPVPQLSHKQLTEAFYGRYKGHIMAKDAYLYFLSSQREGPGGVPGATHNTGKAKTARGRRRRSHRGEAEGGGGGLRRHPGQSTTEDWYTLSLSPSGVPIDSRPLSPALSALPLPTESGDGVRATAAAMASSAWQAPTPTRQPTVPLGDAKVARMLWLVNDEPSQVHSVGSRADGGTAGDVAFTQRMENERSAAPPSTTPPSATAHTAPRRRAHEAATNSVAHRSPVTVPLSVVDLEEEAQHTEGAHQSEEAVNGATAHRTHSGSNGDGKAKAGAVMSEENNDVAVTPNAQLVVAASTSLTPDRKTCSTQHHQATMSEGPPLPSSLTMEQVNGLLNPHNECTSFPPSFIQSLTPTTLAPPPPPGGALCPTLPPHPMDALQQELLSAYLQAHGVGDERQQQQQPLPPKGKNAVVDHALSSANALQKGVKDPTQRRSRRRQSSRHKRVSPPPMEPAPPSSGQLSATQSDSAHGSSLNALTPSGNGSDIDAVENQRRLQLLLQCSRALCAAKREQKEQHVIQE